MTCCSTHFDCKRLSQTLKHHKVVFSDESRSCLCRHKGRRRLRGHIGQRRDFTTAKYVHKTYENAPFLLSFQVSFTAAYVHVSWLTHFTDFFTYYFSHCRLSSRTVRWYFAKTIKWNRLKSQGTYPSCGGDWSLNTFLCIVCLSVEFNLLGAKSSRWHRKSHFADA